MRAETRLREKVSNFLSWFKKSEERFSRFEAMAMRVEWEDDELERFEISSLKSFRKENNMDRLCEMVSTKATKVEIWDESLSSEGERSGILGDGVGSRVSVLSLANSTAMVLAITSGTWLINLSRVSSLVVNSFNLCCDSKLTGERTGDKGLEI